MSLDHNRIIVALDFDTAKEALDLSRKLDPSQCRLKVGKELFTSAGPDLVRQLIALGFDVFLDLKFHDIPNTVAKAVSAACRLGVWMVNVHAAGGAGMMRAAHEAVANAEHKPLLIAVTVLTSMAQEDLAAVGVDRSPLEQVQRLAALAAESGMDGVVCSAQEVTALRALLNHDFILVTPGIRPQGDAAQDQKRIVTPREALRLGSNYLVIGRPVTQAREPGLKLAQIQREIAGSI
ncbi:MAG: orotidine-5'-phosphate decarboxylase [Pseudomonadales bacterium]|nr:orotidine-5'-phosphate decarboxylase [Pseudomonadales bacterium]